MKLSEFKSYYEDLAPPKFKLITRKGGKASKMSKETTPTKTARKYTKTRVEHLKDIVIVVLVTSIMAFVAGMQFADGQNAKTVQAVSQAQATDTAKK